MLTFSCSCGKQLAAQEEHAGKETVCPACGKRILIAEASGPAAPIRGEINDAVERAPTAKSPRNLEDDNRGRPARRGDEDDRDSRGTGPRRRHFDDDRDRPGRRTSESPTSGAAVTSLIFGIISFLCPLVIPNLVAIITGIIGLVAAGQGKKGKGMAISGLILASLSLVLWGVGASIAVPILRERAVSLQSQNNLRQIGVAMHAYHDSHMKFPQAAIFSKEGQPLLSWRVAILPYLEQNVLYKQFKLDEPWDSPHNFRLLEQMPRLYKHPDASEKETRTHYQAFVGAKNDRPGPMFRLDSKFNISLLMITDGTSNTIAVVEGANPVPWSKPEDLPFPWPGNMPALGVGGNHFNVLMADGAVTKRSSKDLPAEVFRNVVTMDDGNMPAAEWELNRVP